MGRHGAPRGQEQLGVGASAGMRCRSLLGSLEQWVLSQGQEDEPTDMKGLA